MMLVENPAHRFASWFRATGWRPSAVEVRGSRIADAETACPLTREPPRSDRHGARNQEVDVLAKGSDKRQQAPKRNGRRQMAARREQEIRAAY